MQVGTKDLHPAWPLHSMSFSRSLRRTSPITFLLAFILAVALLFWLFFGSGDSGGAFTRPGGREILSSKDAASNFLSPPSLPFRKPRQPLAQQPPPPVVHYRLNNITTTSDPIAKRETVLILTPLSRYYPEYFDNLKKLSYPHELISIGFIIPKDNVGNHATRQLQERIARIQAEPEGKRFASITILRQDFEPGTVSQNEAERHAMARQKARRASMARARNSLLFTTLGPTTSWVLWLDADIVETPPSLIQDLARHDKPIIVPNCYQRYFNKEKDVMDVRPYDYNSWVDSPQAEQLAKDMGKDDILLEGYAEMATYRFLMAGMYDAKNPGDPQMEVQLDGVGGTALLVKGEVHRDGAMFPPFAFYHLIETEGFARMAARLGWKSWGLPNYFVSLIGPRHAPAILPSREIRTVTLRYVANIERFFNRYIIIMNETHLKLSLYE